MERVYLEGEAQRLVDAFPAEKLNELLSLAKQAQLDSTVIGSHTRVSMPDGWVYGMYTNCILVAYQDGEQERKAFFVPRIAIHFLFVDEVKAEKSVLKRLPLGYCSCGKPMLFLQMTLWAHDMIERKGPWSYLSKTIGYVAGFFLGIHWYFSGKQQLSLQFNRHWSCL